MATLLQAGAQLSVVVDLAVENQPDAIRATMHRLVAGFREIDDRQTAKPETAATLVKDQLTSVIRSTVYHHIAHSLDQRALDAACRRSVLPDSTDATH